MDSETRTEIEVYDPESEVFNNPRRKEENPDSRYTIYPNTDLKFKKFRGVDLERLIKYNPQIPELRLQCKDTLEYRFLECEKTNGISLDLSHLGIEELPKIPPTVKYLFLSNNNLVELHDMSYLEELEVIDICNNNLLEIPPLPFSIEEISCRNNYIDDISDLSNYNNLKRLDVSYNKLSTIPKISNLELLVCNNNRLSKIYPMDKLRRLEIKNNKLSHLKTFYSLKELECDNNRIIEISELPNITHIYANCNRIEVLDNFDKIKILEIRENKLKKLKYYPMLQYLIADEKLTQLSKKYKMKDIKIYKNNIMVIHFALYT